MQALALLHQHLDQHATVAAYQDCFLLVTLLGLASMPLVLLAGKIPRWAVTSTRVNRANFS